MTRGLDFVADCYGPLLALIAILAPLVSGFRDHRVAFRYYAASGVGILFVYLMKALDGRFALWSAVHLDYSTHSAFAASLVVSLAFFRPRWIGFLAVTLVFYWGLILLLQYHSIPDVLSASFISALFTGGAHWVVGTRAGKRTAG